MMEGKYDYGPQRVGVAESLWRTRLRLLLRNLRQDWATFASNRVGLVGLGIIVIYGLMGLAHPILMGWVWDPNVYDPVIVRALEYQAIPQAAPPSFSHPLGTDPLARDILSQLMFSAQAAFTLGTVAALVTVFIATPVGAVAAYYGGIIDALLMRFADIVIMLPPLSLLIILGAFFGLNLITLGVVIGIISGFGTTAVIVKSQALSIKVRPYIEAARVAGGNNWHIIFTHLIPNLIPLSFLYMMFTATAAIFSEAVLSFLGILDVRMSWGLMIHTSWRQGYLLSLGEFWWLIVPAGASITLLCGSFYLVGRALDEIINPRLRQL